MLTISGGAASGVGGGSGGDSGSGGGSGSGGDSSIFDAAVDFGHCNSQLVVAQRNQDGSHPSEDGWIIVNRRSILYYHKETLQFLVNDDFDGDIPEK